MNWRDYTALVLSLPFAGVGALIITSPIWLFLAPLLAK